MNDLIWENMKTKEVIIEQQKDFIQNLKNITYDFINRIDKSEIETILLSGSVSRADFFPQKKENGGFNCYAQGRKQHYSRRNF